MKNNSKFLIFLFFFVVLIIHNKVYANEIIFSTSDLNITNNGNIINAGIGSAYSKSSNIKIDGQSFKFDKSSSILIANKAKVILPEKNIEINADKLIYDQKISLIKAIGNVEINDLTNIITFKSKEVFYSKIEETIFSNVRSTFYDKALNNYTSEKFTYTLNDSLVKISRANILDVQNNKYYIEKAYINLLTNKLIGKDISLDFNNLAKNNDPRIRGKTVKIDKVKTIIEKGVFTTCKKNDDCPPWEFLASKITHDKKKKTINYENAWLKIYDKPVFYFPKFFHPDPTVKRQSGFLMPSFTGSNSTGSAFTLPYFYVLSNNRDLTFSPRLYSTNKILAQSEYRVVNATSKHAIDLSMLSEKDNSSQSHFFSNSQKKLNSKYFDNLDLSTDLQFTSNDTYLRTYKLDSPLINKDTATLTSSIKFSASKEDLSLETDFIVYEDLNDVPDGDKYEYVYPSYNLKKDLFSEMFANGNFNLNSNGYIKNYNTNVFEKVAINDFLYSSYSRFTNNGLKNNYNILFKNINTDSENSEKYKNNLDTKIASLVEFNTSYPMEKKTDDYSNILKPIISARYSPNNSKNSRDQDRRVNVNNVFALNRLGSNDSVEGGGSLSFGTEFYNTDFSDREVFNLKLANVFKLEEDENLPTNSTLGNKTSDILGQLNYNPNDFFRVNYEFSQDQNLKDTNYEILKNEFTINNFVTTFEYLNENNGIGKDSYLSNKTSYNLKETNSLIFETRTNKKTNSTEFYNLIYQYRNDCLIAAIKYNKDYYTDRDLKTNESIYLNLTIIPFGETKSPNLRK
jgi:LPS-assembly protein